MADSVEGQAIEGPFDDILSLDAMPLSGLEGWLTHGVEFMARNRTELIWAHHYRLLAAWLLAQVHSIPLHVTFHGSLSGPGRVDSSQDALGATLAISRGGKLTAVSREIASQLIALGADERQVLLTPNRVCLPPNEPTRPRSVAPGSPILLVMLTRQQKLAHMREAVRLLHAIRRKGYPAELTIYSGVKASDDGASSHGVVGAMEVARRLGRKWVLRNPALVPVLPLVAFRPPTSRPLEVISNSDVVLGMGRVVLEGLAASKPTILIGYDRTIGLVTKKKLHAYEETNFSGRGQHGEDLNFVVEEMIRALFEGQCADEEIAPLIDVNQTWDNTRQVYEADANQCRNVSSTMEIRGLMDKLLAGAIDEAQLVGRVLGMLSGHERRTYEALLESRK